MAFVALAAILPTDILNDIVRLGHVVPHIMHLCIYVAVANACWICESICNTQFELTISTCLPYTRAEASDGPPPDRCFGAVQRVCVPPRQAHEASIHAVPICIILRCVYEPHVVIDPVCVVQRL